MIDANNNTLPNITLNGNIANIRIIANNNKTILLSVLKSPNENTEFTNEFNIAIISLFS